MLHLLGIWGLLWTVVLPVFSYCCSAWLSEQRLTGLQEESWEELRLDTMGNASSEGSLGSGKQLRVVCLYHV